MEVCRVREYMLHGKLQHERRRGRTKNNNVSLEEVEEVAKFMQQMMRRMDAFKFDQWKGRFMVKVI